MEIKDLFIKFPTLPFITFFLLLAKLLGAPYLPWAVVWAPLVVSISPLILFGSAVMMVLAFTATVAIREVVNAAFARD